MNPAEWKIKPLKTELEFQEGYPIIAELRTELSYDEFKMMLHKAEVADNYSLFGLFIHNKCVAVMGYRFLYDFVHGKHLYIDDLVVKEGYRSRGLGAKLLEFAENEARKRACKGLRLCTGVTNTSGKKFYERNGWIARAIAYKKRL